jgi:hypothetical protein
VFRSVEYLYPASTFQQLYSSDTEYSASTSPALPNRVTRPHCHLCCMYTDLVAAFNGVESIAAVVNRLPFAIISSPSSSLLRYDVDRPPMPKKLEYFNSICGQAVPCWCYSMLCLTEHTLQFRRHYWCRKEVECLLFPPFEGVDDYLLISIP